jgi:hypothetical protein
MFTCPHCQNQMTCIQIGPYWAWVCVVEACKNRRWPTAKRKEEP